MRTNDSLTTADILAIFTDEVADRGGSVTDTFRDRTRLFLRSVLPRVEEVQPHDGLQGGVALKAREGQVHVRPYVFRQVCRNGAIWAHSLESQLSVNLESCRPAEAEYAIREAVGMASADEIFTAAIGQIREACVAPADIELDTLAQVSQLSPRLAAEVLGEIIDRFFDGVDQSRFGLMNAFTSLARDTRDPELRWELEELGGGVALVSQPSPPRPTLAAARSRRPVVVG